MENLLKLVVIVGPTASGKTALSISLAKKFKGEIISADSRKIYTFMNIGSAKPSLEKQEGIVHFGFDLVTPDQRYSVKEFQQYAFEKIKEIHQRGHLPILVGGTGLYISAVVDNYQFTDYEPNFALRQELEKKSLGELVRELKKEDAGALSDDDWSNKRRVVRALEYSKTTGMKFSEHKKKGEPKYDVLQLGMAYDAKKLDAYIKKRIEKMFDMGLLDEIHYLADNYGFDAPGMKAISYQEFKEYIQGKEPIEDVKEKIWLANKQYAKRQMTWFKRDKRIHWIHSLGGAEKRVEEFIK